MEKVRRSIIAGSWYPGEPSVLTSDITGYFNNVPDVEFEGDIVGLVAPHAGYMYSGQVAAYAYKLVCGRKYDAVILIGPSHRVAFSGVSIYSKGGYETPLGVVPVEEHLAADIKKGDKIIVEFPDAHAQEHSLEIHLPFLQIALGQFSFVPLVMGDQSPAVCGKLAEAIYQAVKDRNVLIVGSTDLSHFHNDKKARDLDGIVLDHIKNFDPEGLLNNLYLDKTEACGGGPMAVTMLVSKKMGAHHSQLLKYANSGDVTGDKKSVVGYTSAIYYR